MPCPCKFESFNANRTPSGCPRITFAVHESRLRIITLPLPHPTIRHTHIQLAHTPQIHPIRRKTKKIQRMIQQIRPLRILTQNHKATSVYWQEVSGIVDRLRVRRYLAKGTGVSESCYSVEDCVHRGILELLREDVLEFATRC